MLLNTPPDISPAHTKEYVNPDGTTVQVPDDIIIEGPCVIPSDVELGVNITLVNTVIGEGCKIGLDNKLFDVTAREDVTIGMKNIIINTMIERGVTIGMGCHVKDSEIERFAIIGNSCRLDNVWVADNVRLPSKFRADDTHVNKDDDYNGDDLDKLSFTTRRQVVAASRLQQEPPQS